jgi:hypothetical protein
MKGGYSPPMTGLIVGGSAEFCPNDPVNMYGLEEDEKLNKREKMREVTYLCGQH